MEKVLTLDEIKKRLEFFMKSGTMCHITRFDKSFRNGLILKKVGDEVYLIKERRFGDEYLFLRDIYHIESFTQNNEVRR